MENHTKRIRKARRQGLARNDDPQPTRANLRAGGMAGRDNPAEPRPNARRATQLTNRKTERQAKSTTRRSAGRRSSAS
jgi:hypothetical protein